MVSKTVYLYWNKEINKEKGRYGIQETEDATQDRDEGMAKRNSRATSVQQTWRTTSPDRSQRTEKYERVAPPPGGQTCSKNGDEFSHTFGLVKTVILKREGEISL